MVPDSHQNDEETSDGLDVVGEGIEPEHLVEEGGHLGRAHEARSVLHQQLHGADVPAENLAALFCGERGCVRLTGGRGRV